MPAALAGDAIFSNGFEEPIDWNQCTQGDEHTDPNSQIRPLGFIQITQSWVDAFSATGAFLRPAQGPIATFPNSPGSPVAIPCQRFSNSPSACVADKGFYTVIPFTPTAGLTVDLSWDPVQANPSYGYKIPRPADSMFVGISNCPGDFRAPDANSPVSWLANGCRRIGSGATIIYSTRPGPASNEFVCRLTPGVTAYINIAPLNPVDGITPGEHTCSDPENGNSDFGCDVQIVSRGNSFLRGTD